MSKTNSGLLAYARAQVGLPYWYGTYGKIATEDLYKAKRKQYPDFYTAADFPSQYGKRVHDCVGLVKGYLWSDSPTAAPKYDAAQDKSARGMYAAATVKGEITTFPGKAGQLVFKGTSPTKIYHVGIYDGEGHVVEARGHAYGVVVTDFKATQWAYWAQCPYIEADAVEDIPADDSVATAPTEAPGGNKISSTVTYTLVLPLVQKGDSGPLVETFQTILRARGYSLGAYGPNGDGVDGEFGNATENAVEAFQEDNTNATGEPLEVDGKVGGETWTTLLGL